MSELENIVEKIKKLLRMKRGGTPGEIENALALAAKLAREHDINLDGIDPDETTQEIHHVQDILTSRLPLEARYAAAILVNFFNVSIVVNHQRVPQSPWYWQYAVSFVGTDWDRNVARYVFYFLQKQFRWAWSHRANRRLRNRAAFLEGMFLGLASKLEAERTANQLNKQGVILIGRGLKLRENYVKEHWPHAGTADNPSDNSGAVAAKYAGLQAGEKTNIRSAVNQGESEPVRAALPPPVGQLAFL